MRLLTIVAILLAMVAAFTIPWTSAYGMESCTIRTDGTFMLATDCVVSGTVSLLGLRPKYEVQITSFDSHLEQDEVKDFVTRALDLLAELISAGIDKNRVHLHFASGASGKELRSYYSPGIGLDGLYIKIIKNK